MLRVFPTETVARSFLMSYAKESPNKALFADDFISWDTFKRLCTAIPEGKRAEYTNRLIFADSFINSSKVKDLRYFYSADYPESAEGFAKEIATNLPSFKKALLSTSPMPKDLRSDMNLLLAAYSKYLAEHNLYQDTYLEPDFAKAPEETRVYFADSLDDTDAEILISGVKEGKLGNIKLVENEEPLKQLTVFPNTMAEINQVMRRVRLLLKNNTPARDIAITVTNIKEVLPYITEQAKIRNIPLNILQGQTLDCYPAGRFFTGLNELVTGDYSMEAMKAFLLNPSFPLNKREVTVSIVRNGIELGIMQGGKAASNWVYRLSAKGLEPEAGYVKTLAELSGRIVHAKNVDDFKVALRRFQDEFFEDGSWDSMHSPSDSAAFQRCMEMADAVKDSGYCGNKPFQIILDVFKKTMYQPQPEGMAVSLIPYPMSAGLRVKHHFVLGLDDASTRINRTPVPFDAENSDSTDVGDAVLAAYCYKPQELHLSCSIETYHGTASVPSLFIKNKMFVNSTEAPNDSFVTEAANWKNKRLDGTCTWLQKEAFETAKDTTLAPESVEKINTSYVKVNLSATSIQTFSECPFKYLMNYGLRLNKIDFDVQMEDHLEIGNLLHRTFERYFEKVRSFNNGEKPENLILLEQYFEEEVNSYCSQPDGPDSLFKNRLIQQFKDGLKMIFKKKVSKDYRDSDLVKTEKEFSFDFEGYKVTGSIDALFKTTDGQYYLIDFKKGSSCNKRQLFIYSKALENDPEIATAATLGAFYSIGERNFKYKTGTKDEFVMESKNLDEEMASMIERIKTGNFPLTADHNNCTNCDFRRICRRGYVIK